MSYSIKPSGSDPTRIDITTNTEELADVKTYGHKVGKIAEKMGLAQAIKGEGDQLYYVSIRSLGKAWSQERKTRFPQEEPSPRKTTMEKVKGYFKDRSNKAEDGKSVIGYNDWRESINEIAIKTFIASEVFKENGDQVKDAVGKLLDNKSNLTEVYTELASLVKKVDHIHDSTWSEVFKDVKTLTDHGKSAVIMNFIKHMSKEPPPSVTTLSKSRRIDANIAAAERQNAMKAAVDAYFALRTMLQIKDHTIRRDHTKLKGFISELLFNKSNLNAVFIKVSSEIRDLNDIALLTVLIPYDSAEYRRITEVLYNLTPSEQYQFIKILEEELKSIEDKLNL